MTTKTKSTKYIVTLAVKNGPFQTKELAERESMALRNKGIETSEVSKIGAGYKFVSKVRYGAPSAPARDNVISKINAHIKKMQIPKSAVSVTTKSA